jgi:transcriptional regulator of acetoin/glycerol metabolism
LARQHSGIDQHPVIFLCPELGEFLDLENMPGAVLEAPKGVFISAKGMAGEAEKERLVSALLQAEGKKTEASSILRVRRQTIRKKIKNMEFRLRRPFSQIT